MFFDRYEIHIQALVDFLMENLSLSDPHLRKILFKNDVLKVSTNKQTLYIEHTFSKFQLFESHICKDNILWATPSAAGP